MSSNLQSFIEHARNKGFDHATIKMLLLSAGWKEREIAEALTNQGLEMQIPRPPDSGGAKEAFLHLLSFAALYTLVISLIILFFQYIDRWLPDPAFHDVYRNYDDTSGIRWCMAAVIVALPLLLWMLRIIDREMTLDPDKAWSGIRRWLTYLTLLIASVALMIDIIALIFQFLEGELTIRFFLKFFTIFSLIGGAFLYFYYSLKSVGDTAVTLRRTFGRAAAIVTIVALVLGAWIVGTPGSERGRKLDERRIQDLREIQSAVMSIVYDDKGGKDRGLVNPIPETLDEIVEKAQYRRPNINDPETGDRYGYGRTDRTHFSLCALFDETREKDYDIAWNHQSGTHCFEFDTERRYEY